MNDFSQCLLQHDNNYIVAFIPSEFAIIGKSLEIRQNKKWEKGYIVLEIFDTLGSEHFDIPDIRFESRMFGFIKGRGKSKIKKEKL